MSDSTDTVVAEIWKAVPESIGERYRVSNLGRVQSRRGRNGMPAAAWRDLTPVLDSKGYPQVRLSGPRGPKWWFVSRLVLTVFVGEPGPGIVARHVLTNNPLDSRLANLAWGSQAQNCADKIVHGTHQVGDRHPLVMRNRRRAASAC